MTEAASQTTKPGIFRVSPNFVERIWGRRNLSPWISETFANAIGEAWLTGPSCIVTTGIRQGATLASVVQEFPEALGQRDDGEFPLLVKMLFPQERLSVQVHPDDEQAADLGGSVRAKTECWYVLSANEGASVSLGLKTGVTIETVQKSLGTPAFEDLLRVLPVTAGDMLYVEAGTVHAIGGGLTLLEVQQPSDTTFRLYDYGRPRDLHLDEGLAVVKLETASGKVAPEPIANGLRLLDVPHFTVERFSCTADEAILLPGQEHPSCLIGLSGACEAVSSGACVQIVMSEAVVVPAASALTVRGHGTFIRCTPK